MTSALTKTILFALCIFIVGNLDAQTKTNAKQNKKEQLIPIDFSDPNYVDVQFYARDTITKDGWRIQYYVKNDRTKYSDIYIKWSKGKYAGVFYGGDMLLMRRYFIPIFIGETSSRIFLKHACATECTALLILSKDSMLNQQHFVYVRDYDINLEQIVYTPEKSYSLDTLEVAVVDLNRNIEKTVVFDNICNLTPEDSCIDSIAFSKSSVTLYANLLDKTDKSKEVKENHVVSFDK